MMVVVVAVKSLVIVQIEHHNLKTPTRCTVLNEDCEISWKHHWNHKKKTREMHFGFFKQQQNHTPNTKEGSMKRGTLCTLFFLFVINTDREADRKIKRERKKKRQRVLCV